MSTASGGTARPPDALRVRRPPELLVEVAGHQPAGLSVGTVDGGRERRQEARVRQHRDEGPPGPQDPVNGDQRGVEVRDVHQRELAGDEVERGVRQFGEPLCVRLEVADAQGLLRLVAAGGGHEFGGQVGSGHLGPRGGEGARGGTLAAADVQHAQPGHVAGEGQGGGHREAVRAAPGRQERVVPVRDVRPGDLGPGREGIRRHADSVAVGPAVTTRPACRASVTNGSAGHGSAHSRQAQHEFEPFGGARPVTVHGVHAGPAHH